MNTTCDFNPLIHKEKSKPILKDGLKYILLTFFSIIMAFPFLWLLVSSIKTKDEIWLFPPTIWPEVPQWQNFTDVLKAAPFSQYMFNSAATALAIVLIQLISSAMIAYAFTQLNFRGRNLLFSVVMATYMLPSAVTYVPSYIFLAKINLLDSLQGLVISNAASVFGIFLIRQAFLQIKKELVDAARIDGAGHLRILWQILIPLCKSSFITLALISFVTNYNSYLWPSLIIKSQKNYLITIGLRQFFIQDGAYGIKWPLVMAASTITILPLLMLFFTAQKWFMKSIGDTGVKG
jgi:multiple sugar transport system permease protein